MKITSTFFLVTIIVFSFNSLKGQQVEFEKKYGGNMDDIGFSLCPVPSGGYAVFGWTKSYGNGNADYYLIRTNQNGDTLWTKTFGGSDSESGLCIEITSDGGFILGGTSRTYGAGAGDCWLLKTDSAGNSIWNKTYGGVGEDYIRQVKQTSDGGYIFAGFTTSSGNGGKDIFLVKTDSVGNISWSNTYGGTNDEEGWSVEITSDGGYIVGGWTQSYGNGQADFYLIKTNSLGIVSWSKTYGGSNSDSGISVKQTSDGGYIFTGTTRSYGAGMGDVWLLKIKSNGDTLWTKTFGGIDEDYGRGVCIRQSGYAVIGFTKSYGNGLSDISVILTDTLGNLTNNYQFGGINEDEGWNIYTENNDLLIVGQTSSNSNGLNDVYFIKISKEPFSINELNDTNELIIYPNPASDNIFIKSTILSPVIIELYDLTSRKIFSKSISLLSNYTIDISSLPKGVYVIEIKSEGKSQRGKIIKE